MNSFTQRILALTKATYEAQKVASNLTIQHTVSASLDNVPPECVTDIVVEDTVASDTKIRFRAVAVGSVTISYTLNVYDSTLTIEKLRNKLVQFTTDGTMNANFRHYSAVFNASFSNGSFTEPLVTSAAVQRASSERLTGVMIALVVVGVLLGLALLVGGLLFKCYRQEITSPPPIVTVRREKGQQQV